MTRNAIGWICLLTLATGVASPSAGAAAFLAFTPAGPETGAGAPSPEGCISEGLARARLTPSAVGTTCHSGAWGVLTPGLIVGEYETDTGPSTALFETDPLAAASSVSGPARLVVYYFTTNQNNYGIVGQTPTQSYLEYRIDEVLASGEVRRIAYGTAFELPGMNSYPSVERHEAAVDFAPRSLAAGSRLRVSLTSTVAPDGRLLFGDQPLEETPYSAGPYTDAGLWLEMTGAAGPPPDEAPPLPEQPPVTGEPPVTTDPTQEEPAEPEAQSGGGGGGLPFLSLALLGGVAALRRGARGPFKPRALQSRAENCAAGANFRAPPVPS